MKCNIIFIIFLFVSVKGFSQELTQADLEFYISNLSKVNDDHSWEIDYFIKHRIVEAVPNLEQYFWQQNCNNQRYFLEGLYFLGSSLTHQYALALFDSLSTPEKEFYDPTEKYNSIDCGDLLRARVFCIQILYRLGDYSKTDEVFELIQREKEQGSSEIAGINLLPFIIRYRPDLKEQAKQELMQAINTASDDRALFLYSLALSSAFDEEEIPEIVQIFKNSSSPQVKRALMQFYFSRYENKFDLNGLVKESLLTEPNEELRLFYVKVLLLGFATPSDYVFIKNYNQSESNDTIKSLIQYEINSFIPAPIDTAYSVIDLLNNLNNYIDSVSAYNWLGDLTFFNELKNILTTTKTNLQAGDSLACRVQVKAFQDLVDNVYKDSLNTDPRFVTIEGWKFLYWNAQYILDRLPEPPVIANADIEVINPAMSLVNPGAFTMEVKGTGFTTNSIVYFNGNARATTFVADTLLTAEIQSTDVSAAGSFPVWVSSGAVNSDTLIYKVVNTLPKPVRPVLECVTNNGDGTYTAYFGYKNDNTVSVYIPAGIKNKFTPTPQDRGQTKVFLPGRHYRVFTVTFNGSNLVWTLNGRTSTASSNSAPCN